MLFKTSLKSLVLSAIFLAVYLPLHGSNALPPISWSDVAGWKHIPPASASFPDNGQWFAYWYSPNKGDSELILRQTTAGSQLAKTWEIGETAGNARTSIVFNADASFLGFVKFPAGKAKEKASRDNRPQNKLVLVDLDDLEEKTFDNLKGFSFSKKHPAWVAIHLTTPRQGQGNDAARGADLLLYHTTRKTTFNIGNVSDYAFNVSGDWLAYLIDATGMAGNGIFLRNMNTGEILSMETGKARYTNLRWTEEGDALVALKALKDDDYEDDLHHVVALRKQRRGGFEKIVVDPSGLDGFPEGMTISPNRPPSWTKDLTRIDFGIHQAAMKQGKQPKDTSGTDEAAPSGKPGEKPDLVIWHWEDPRLQSVQQVRRRSDENQNYLSVFHVDNKRFVRLADEAVSVVIAPEKGRFAIGYDNEPYELLGSLSGVNYRDIYKIDLQTAEKSMILEQHRIAAGNPVSPDGNYMVYFEEGHYFVYHLETDEIINVTENIPTSFVNKRNDVNVEYPPTASWGWTSDSRSLILTDNYDVWRVDYNGRNAVNLTVNGEQNAWIYQSRIRIEDREDGIDLSKPMFIRMMDDNTKQTGIARIDRGRPGAKILLMEDAIFSGLSKIAETDLYSFVRQTPQEAPNYYLARGVELENIQKLTDVYPEQNELAWSPGQRLLEFVSDKGDTLQAALYLPAGYEEGKSYPTVVYIYERLTQNLNSYARPSFPGGGFNRSIYTSNGYAVLMPDIVYKLNDPGMSAVWCVLPALDAAIETGIADADNVAIHGHSWGGYQTSHLITQTNRFKAAVAGAPLTNMISMYSLIYWNTGGANQAIFESSQGRFTSGYWDNWEAYKRNSPVFYAANVQTPLLLMHNDKDGAVDFTQGIEYYNTLRRLKKPVIMLQYEGENHGLRKLPNQADYAMRMMEFLDHYLKGAEAPAWLLDGVPLLEMEKHLEDRPRVFE